MVELRLKGSEAPPSEAVKQHTATDANLGYDKYTYAAMCSAVRL